jgi:tRNA modification GTPase
VLKVVDASLSDEAAGVSDDRAKSENEGERSGQNDNERELSMLNAEAKNCILVLNKVDLGVHEDWASIEGVRFSCKTREGQEGLNEAIWDFVMSNGMGGEDFRIAISARHQACLQKAIIDLEAAKIGLAKNELPELVSIELRSALDSIGDVVGRHDTEDLLGRIFSEFCIVK